MKVTVEIPDRIGWALAGHAERRGMNVGTLIANMVNNAYKPTPEGRMPSLSRRVRDEWERGAPDPVIAHRLHMSLGTVRSHRRRLGLEAHQFRREQWQHELTPASPPAEAIYENKEN